jgi:hypothetical protein
MAFVAEELAVDVAVSARGDPLIVNAANLLAMAFAHDLIAQTLELLHVVVACAVLGQDAGRVGRGRF